MGELVVRRWRKYGHDRLYVTTAGGAKIGWRDQKTGESHLDDVAFQQAFDRAISSFLGVADLEPPTGPLLSPEAGVTLPPAAPPVTEPEVGDLSLNRPGQMARDKATQEAAAQRERGRIRNFLLRATDAKTEERSWRVGADGEEAIGSRLEKLLDHGWTVLHSIPIGEKGSDIDHVLIGPGGVFTVNTKRHPNGKIWVARNTIMVNGQKVPYLRNSRHEAQRASKLLSAATGEAVEVRGVLIFMTGTVIPNLTIKEHPDDVVILDRLAIPRAFRKAPQRLSSERIHTIAQAARRVSTWKEAPES